MVGGHGRASRKFQRGDEGHLRKAEARCQAQLKGNSSNRLTGPQSVETAATATLQPKFLEAEIEAPEAIWRPIRELGTPCRSPSGRRKGRAGRRGAEKFALSAGQSRCGSGLFIDGGGGVPPRRLALAMPNQRHNDPGVVAVGLGNSLFQLGGPSCGGSAYTGMWRTPSATRFVPRP